MKETNEKVMEEFEDSGLKVRIYKDPDPLDPRRQKRFGVMACRHRDYELGDGADRDSLGVLRGQSREEQTAILNRAKAVWLPLYLLDYFGIWMRTTQYAKDPGGWDRAFTGFIYALPGTVERKFGKCGSAEREMAKSVLEGEVRRYNQFLSGDVYGYEIADRVGSQLDTSYGHFGLDGVREAARTAVARHVGR